MASTIEKIRDSFPFPTVEPIVGQPTYDAIKNLHQKLSTNAASVHSHLGNGRLGLLYLTVKPEIYNTLSNVQFDPPTNPGPSVTYPENATQYQIKAADKQHELDTKLFVQYDACDRALKQLLLGAVDDIFVNALHNPHVGYANVTTLELITHLYDNYGKISDHDLQKNQETMKEEIDLNLPIENFFRRVEDCVDYAAAGNTPFTPEQVVSSAFYSVQQTGMMLDDVREWKRKPRATKTWDAFKTHFAAAHNEMRESIETSTTAGFHPTHTANAAEAINNLANATVADRETMANLTSTISTLTKQLAETNAKLSQALQLTSSLQVEVESLKQAAKKSSPALNKYCWTHGRRCNHSSKECRQRATGHQEDATEENKMGGKATRWYPRKK